MPELPEVEVTRRGLAPQLAGRVISGVEVREPRLRWPVPQAVRELAGRTVRAVLRRGKYLLVDCGDGHLILHLGMSGSLRLLAPGTPAQKHDHFDLVLGDRLLRLGLPVTDRSPYDEFMLHFHDWLKASESYQQNCRKYRFDLPPGSTWLVFTDVVPHAVLGGRLAFEQTVIVSRNSLANPALAPASILERLAGKTLTA